VKVTPEEYRAIQRRDELEARLQAIVDQRVHEFRSQTKDRERQRPRPESIGEARR
jgi:hypothetical protein